jgi:hypothetical protein
MQGGLPNYEILATNKNKGKLRHRPHEMCHPVYLFSSVPSKFELPTLSFFFVNPQEICASLYLYLIIKGKGFLPNFGDSTF